MRTTVISLLGAASVLILSTLSANAGCPSVCQQKCANAVAAGREPSQAACVSKWSRLNARGKVELTGADGRRVTVNRAHNYDECIRFGNGLGYTMEERRSYCARTFGR